MQEPNFGVVDLGSNTIHLLIARSDGQTVIPLVDTSVGLRLGQHVDRHGRIGAAKRRELLRRLLEFQATARRAGVEHLHFFATHAIRVAANREALGAAITAATGRPLTLLTPEQEAMLAFQGVASVHHPVGRQAVVDIGGGSMQIAVGAADQVEASCSLPLGAATVAHRFLTSDPPTPGEVYGLQAYLSQVIPPALPTLGGPITGLVGTGGTLRRVLRLLGCDAGTPLPVAGLTQVAAMLQGKPASAIAAQYHLKAGRARLLLPAVVLLQEVLRCYGTPPLAIVQAGLREGAILHLARRSRGSVQRVAQPIGGDRAFALHLDQSPGLEAVAIAQALIGGRGDLDIARHPM